MPFVLVATVLVLVVAASVVDVAFVVFGRSLEPFREQTFEKAVMT